ncbi:polysaccharide deacetylase family protein [bacterium]|nr:polysaccharide deacetylase family protein [bacterium]
MRSIFQRYGFKPNRYCTNLFEMIELCLKYKIHPTFPVTASVVKRHPEIFKEAQDLGVEFAVHGLKHIDYTQLPDRDVMQHAQKAIDIFNLHGINTCGFRYPYLRSNAHIVEVLKCTGYSWDSSNAIVWTGVKQEQFNSKIWDNYQNILNTYEATKFCNTKCLPEINDNFIHLPVSVPDDDILIERLELKDNSAITNILYQMLEEHYKKESLFILQLHPERFVYFKTALENILKEAMNRGTIWMASLNEISSWWKKRSEFRFKFENAAQNWELANMSDKPCNLEVWQAGERIVSDLSHKWTANYMPAIAVNANQKEQWLSTIKNSGYSYILDTNLNDAAVQLPENVSKITSELLDEIVKNSSEKILKLANWPSGKKSCIAVSGDIDGIDLIDFWERFRGN